MIGRAPYSLTTKNGSSDISQNFIDFVKLRKIYWNFPFLRKLCFHITLHFLLRDSFALVLLTTTTINKLARTRVGLMSAVFCL